MVKVICGDLEHGSLAVLVLLCQKRTVLNIEGSNLEVIQIVEYLIGAGGLGKQMSHGSHTCHIGVNSVAAGVDLQCVHIVVEVHCGSVINMGIFHIRIDGAG